MRGADGATAAHGHPHFVYRRQSISPTTTSSRSAALELDATKKRDKREPDEPDGEEDRDHAPRRADRNLPPVSHVKHFRREVERMRLGVSRTRKRVGNAA